MNEYLKGKPPFNEFVEIIYNYVGVLNLLRQQNSIVKTDYAFIITILFMEDHLKTVSYFLFNLTIVSILAVYGYVSKGMIDSTLKY